MKLRTLLMAGMLCASLALPADALVLEVDGVDKTSEAKATAVQGNTYVSLRAAAALLVPSAQVSWVDGTAAVTAPNISLTARPGDQYLQVNGRYIYMANKVQTMDGSVMVALRPLADALGGTVDWDNASDTAVLRTGGEPAEAPYSEVDLYWLSRIISAESRGEPLQGKIAVGTVVLNRVASDRFPDTIYDVIFQNGQFEPVRNKTVFDTPTEESVLAAQLCLQGAREAGESLYFLAPDLTSNHWTMNHCTYVTTIGCHWFYC